MQQAAISARAEFALCGACLFHSEISRDGDYCAELATKFFEPVQISLCERNWRDAPGANERRELADRGIENIFVYLFLHNSVQLRDDRAKDRFRLIAV